MATSQHTPTRRAVLGAPLALAVIGTAAAQCVAQPATAAITTDDWNRAVAEYREKRREWLAHPATDMSFDDPRYEAASREERELCHAHCDRVEAIMLAPAPTFAALIEKLEICRAEEAWAHSRFDARWMMSAFIADVRRLGGEARS